MAKVKSRLQITPTMGTRAFIRPARRNGCIKTALYRAAQECADAHIAEAMDRDKSSQPVEPYFY